MSRCLIYTLITRHQGKKTREKRKEKKTQKRKESQTTLICKNFNDMYFIVSMHAYTYENEEETDESKNSNSIANGFERNACGSKKGQSMKKTQN